MKLKIKIDHRPQATTCEATAALYAAANEAKANGSVHPVEFAIRHLTIYDDITGSRSGVVAIPCGKSPFEKMARGIFGAVYKSNAGVISGFMQYTKRSRERAKQPLPFSERIKLLDLLPSSFRYQKAIGLEMEGFSLKSRDQIGRALPYFSRAVSDASIRPNSSSETPAEIKAVFPRGMLEPRLYKLTEKLKALGMKCNKTCGLHVHFDMRGRTEEEVVKIAKRTDKWLKALQELVPASRRNQTYCKWGVSTSDRYRAVNVCSFSKYKTLEIRLHSATFDYAKILSWVRLCELLLAIRYNPKDGDCVATLGQLPLMDYEASYWRARHQSLNPTQYSTSASTTEENE